METHWLVVSVSERHTGQWRGFGRRKRRRWFYCTLVVDTVFFGFSVLAGLHYPLLAYSSVSLSLLKSLHKYLLNDLHEIPINFPLSPCDRLFVKARSGRNSDPVVYVRTCCSAQHMTSTLFKRAMHTIEKSRRLRLSWLE